MMKKYSLNIPSLLTTIGIVSFLIVGIFLSITGDYKWEHMPGLLWNYGIVTIPLSILWFFFDRIGWRQSRFRHFSKFFRFPPDVRGRWQGTLYRAGDETPHEFIIEIDQTMTQLQVCTYSKGNISESILDAFVTNQSENYFSLCYLWEGEAGKLVGQNEESGKFKGYTILRLVEIDGRRKLTGMYFTARKPQQTMGKIEVVWVGMDLHRLFE